MTAKGISATQNAEAENIVKFGPAEAYIAELIEDRKHWQNGTLKSSTDELYELLGKCVGVYELMTRDDAEGERLRNELEIYCKEQKLKFKGETHTITKIVRAVFNNDRRMYTNYGKALRVAIERGKKKHEVVPFLRANNGIDGVIKLATTGVSPESLETRANKVWETMKSEKLASVSSEKLKLGTDQAHINKPVVLLATQLANGEFTVHMVVKKSTVVNSTFATFFNEKEHASVKVSAEATAKKVSYDRDLIRKQIALIAA